MGGAGRSTLTSATTHASPDPSKPEGLTVEAEIRLDPSELERYRLEGRLRNVGSISQRLALLTLRAQQDMHSYQANIADRLLLLEPVETKTYDDGKFGPESRALSTMPSPLQLGLTLEHLPDPIPSPKGLLPLPKVLGAELLIGLDVILARRVGHLRTGRAV